MIHLENTKNIKEDFQICEAAVGEIIKEIPNYKSPERLEMEEKLRAAFKMTIIGLTTAALLIILYIILVELDIIPSYAEFEAMMELLMKIVVTIFAMIFGNVCPLPIPGPL